MVSRRSRTGGKRRGCPKTGKVRYPDHQAAVIALRKARKFEGSEKLASRVYQCAMCRGWHLTSKDSWEPRS